MFQLILADGVLTPDLVKEFEPDVAFAVIKAPWDTFQKAKYYKGYRNTFLSEESSNPLFSSPPVKEHPRTYKEDIPSQVSGSFFIDLML